MGNGRYVASRDKSVKSADSSYIGRVGWVESVRLGAGGVGGI